MSSRESYSNDVAKSHLSGDVQTVPQLVNSYDAGIVDGNGYASLSGFSDVGGSEVIHDENVRPSIALERCRKVIIVGAGVSGIQQAAVLLGDGQVQHEDIQVFDALDGFGGVWKKNTYPGCACDVPSMIYTTSFHINKSESPIRIALADELC